MRRVTETLIAVFCALALIVSAAPSGALAAPPATTTRYMSTTDYDNLYNPGCSQTDESGAIILDFGQPWFDGSSYGTIIFGSITFRSIDDIENAVRGFLSGYYLCGGSGTMRLAVGTSNYRGSTGYRHGQAWAQMVNRVN